MQSQGLEGRCVQVLFQGGRLKIMILHTVRSDLDSGASHQLLKCHIDHKKNQLEYDLFRKKKILQMPNVKKYAKFYFHISPLSNLLHVNTYKRK